MAHLAVPRTLLIDQSTDQLAASGLWLLRPSPPRASEPSAAHPAEPGWDLGRLRHRHHAQGGVWRWDLLHMCETGPQKIHLFQVYQMHFTIHLSGIGGRPIGRPLRRPAPVADRAGRRVRHGLQRRGLHCRDLGPGRPRLGTWESVDGMGRT